MIFEKQRGSGTGSPQQQHHLDELNHPARRCLRFEEGIHLQSKNGSSNPALKDEFPGKQAAPKRKVISKIDNKEIYCRHKRGGSNLQQSYKKSTKRNKGD